MRIIKGKYINGEIKIDVKPEEIKGERTVYVIFPEEEVKYFDFSEILRARGIISVGGDAVKDSEDIYNE